MIDYPSWYKPRLIEAHTSVGHDPKNLFRKIIVPARISNSDNISWMTEIADFDIAQIGWIPLIRKRNEWPSFAKEAVLGRHRLQLRLLFRSGNECTRGDPANPDPDKADLNTLLRLEDSQNYRAMLSVRNIRVFRDGNLRPVQAQMDFMGKTGFTPIRLPFQESPLFYMHGRKQGNLVDDDLDIVREETADQTMFKLNFYFLMRLSLRADLMNMLMTMRIKRIPWAWLGLSLEITPESAEVKFTGSAVPNRSQYLTGIKASKYDLTTLSPDPVWHFFNAKKRAPASPELPLWWTVRKVHTTRL